MLKNTKLENENVAKGSIIKTSLNSDLVKLLENDLQFDSELETYKTNADNAVKLMKGS